METLRFYQIRRAQFKTAPLFAHCLIHQPQGILRIRIYIKLVLLFLYQQ